MNHTQIWGWCKNSREALSWWGIPTGWVLPPPPKSVPGSMAEELGSNAGRAQLAMRTSNASRWDKDLDEKVYQKAWTK